MLFVRKIRGAFGQIESRDWALLALETFSVVVGILIAFELNEWSIRRSEDKRARLLVARLFEESEDDVGSLVRWRDLMAALHEVERDFAVQLSKGKCPAEPHWSAVETIGFYPSLIVSSSVYEEMMGSGGLAALHDPAARNAVQSFRASLAFTTSQIEYFRASVVDPVPSGDRRRSVMLSEGAEFTVKTTYDRAALCADKSFRNQMVDGTRNHAAIGNVRSDLTDKAIAMCAHLGRLVGRQCTPDGKALSALDAATAKVALSSEP